jgi:acetyl-CoA carboxylase carboxyltransferase component
VFAHDTTVFGGSMGYMHGRKVYKIHEMALDMGVPIIGLNDSTGARVIRSVMREEVSMQDLGGSDVHCRTSGVADFRVPTEQECMLGIKRLLSFLPSNWREKPASIPCEDDTERLVPSLEEAVPIDQKRVYDMHRVIKELVDQGDFLEVKPEFAGEILTGFARMGGSTVGIVANQPMVFAGCMTVNSSDKQARFIRFCDAFNIPVILLVDTPGYLPGKDQEHAGIIRHGAKVLYALSEARVPKIAILLRKVYGGAALGMGVLPGFGIDLIYAYGPAPKSVPWERNRR